MTEAKPKPIPKPLADRVILEPMTAALPFDFMRGSDHQRGPLMGRVVSVGRLVQEVRLGDCVYFGRYVGVDLVLPSGSYVCLQETEIIAVVVPEQEGDDDGR